MTVDRINDAPWQPLPEDPWCVIEVDNEDVTHLYVSFNKSGDDLAGKPFTKDDAEAFASQLGPGAMAAPLEQTLQPGI